MSDFHSENDVRSDDGLADCQTAVLFLALIGADLLRIDGVLEGMAAAGHGAAAMSQFLGCAPTQVISELEARKIQIDEAQLNKPLRKRKGGWSPDECAFATAGWLNGVSVKVLCEFLGRAPGAIYGKKNRMGLKARPRVKTIMRSPAPEHEQSRTITPPVMGNEIAISEEVSTSHSRSLSDQDIPPAAQTSSPVSPACAPVSDDALLMKEPRASADHLSNEAHCEAAAPLSKLDSSKVQKIEPRAQIFIPKAEIANSPKPSEKTPLYCLARPAPRPDHERPDRHDVAGWCAWFRETKLKDLMFDGMKNPDEWVEVAVRWIGGESVAMIATAMNLKFRCAQERISRMHLSKPRSATFAKFDGRLLETTDLVAVSWKKPSTSVARGCPGRLLFKHEGEVTPRWRGDKLNKQRHGQTKKGKEQPKVTVHVEHSIAVTNIYRSVSLCHVKWMDGPGP